MAFFVLVPAAYNYGFAHLLLVAGIDQRLPVWISRLNKYRVPAHAILFQATVASVFATVFFLVVPYLVHIGNPADLTTQVYMVDQASATLVWSISTAFLFFNLAKFLRGGRALLLGKLVAPQWICVIVGPLACLATIIDTLFFSWTPLITNSKRSTRSASRPVQAFPSLPSLSSMPPVYGLTRLRAWLETSHSP